MKMRLLPLAVAAVIAAPVPALALDEAAVMQRLEQLEQQRRADQAEIDALRQKVEQLQSGGGATLSSSEAQQLREEIIKVDKRAASRVGSLRNAVDAERQKLTVNGFMSGYAVKSTDEAIRFGTGIRGDDWNFRSDTIAGVQLTYRMDEKTDAVIQLVADGREDYELEATWAFLRYAVTPDTKVRLGRLAMPLFLYTETIDVGFTYPWVRPPVEMYGVGTYRYQGLDVKHDFQLLGWNTSVTGFFGDNDSTAGLKSAKWAGGVTANAARGPWTLQAAYAVVDEIESAEIPFPGLNGKVTYNALGVRYDDGTWFGIVEGSRIKGEGSLGSLLPSVNAFYGTFGYQFDRVMPYITLAKSYSFDDGDPFRIPGTAIDVPPVRYSQESVGLGLRYTLTDKVVLKGEVTRFSDFDGTAGIEKFATNPRDPEVLRRLNDDGATVMSIGFDAAF